MTKRKRKPDPPHSFPRSIQIAGHVITIELDDQLMDRAACFGQYHTARNLIVIDPKVPGSIVSETLLHEIIEAINDKCELRLEHNQIQSLALMLHQALESAK